MITNSTPYIQEISGLKKRIRELEQFRRGALKALNAHRECIIQLGKCPHSEGLGYYVSPGHAAKMEYVREELEDAVMLLGYMEE